MKKELLLVASCFLIGCGGGGGSTSEPAPVPAPAPPPPEPTTLTGIFVDAAVEGLAFETASQSGFSNADGEFTYQQGEQIKFSIGAIEFPEISATDLITPFELFDTKNIEDLRVTNAIRLLQSLDADGEPENGITITEEAHQIAENLTLDFASETFEQDTLAFLTDLALVHQQLIPTEQARYHFNQSLTAIGYNRDAECGSDHAMVGYSGHFQTRAHNVSGSARIVDNCTIEVTSFNYDGLGPLVFFYGAINQEFADESAFAIGESIDGTPFDNASLLLKLPAGKTLDDLNSLSVWCVEFNADFGSLTFTP